MRQAVQSTAGVAIRANYATLFECNASTKNGVGRKEDGVGGRERMWSGEMV